MATMSEIKLEIARLYVATFNRVPDVEGFNYWLKEYQRGFSIEKIAASFMLSDEASEKYPQTQSNSEFLDAIYLNVLGRAPDAAGKAYWNEKLEKGMQRSTFILAIINGALVNNGDDANYLNNRAKYGVFCVTNNIDSDTAAANLRTITADSSSLDAVSKINIESNLTASPSDKLIGGDGNDSFFGNSQTAQTTDIVNGSAGTDTLLLDGTNTIPSTSGVEILIIKKVGGVVDISSNSDIQMLTIDSPSADADYILAGQSVAIQNAQTAHTYNLKYGPTANAAQIALNGVGSSGSKSTINLASGAAVGSVVVTTTGKDSYIVMQNSGYSPIKTMIISGDKALDVDVSDASLASMNTIDGSSNTAGITLKLAGMSDIVYNITGGLGNDSIDMSSRLTAADKIDGGAGADTLKVVDSAIATTDANLKSIEYITLTGKTTINLTGQTESFIITGSEYDDTIIAGLGADQISGGAGNDTIYTANGGLNDKIDGGSGEDTLVIGGALTLVGDSNISNIEFITLGSAASVDISDQSDAFTISGSNGADTIKLGSGGETIKFAATAALNGSDTFYNFNPTNDKIDITRFLGENSAVVKTTPANFSDGLDLKNGYNVGVIYNKSEANLLATDIASSAAANKIALDDNGRALVFVTADSDGIKDSVNSSYSLYFVEDTNAARGSITFAVTKVGVFINTSELSAADLIAATFI